MDDWISFIQISVTDMWQAFDLASELWDPV